MARNSGTLPRLHTRQSLDRDHATPHAHGVYAGILSDLSDALTRCKTTWPNGICPQHLRRNDCIWALCRKLKQCAIEDLGESRLCQKGCLPIGDPPSLASNERLFSCHLQPCGSGSVCAINSSHDPKTFIWVPPIWLPLTLICLAISWLLSATGVYLRDAGQSIGVVINMAMFLSTVFYPMSALPVRRQPLLKLNPIAATIDQTRMAAIHGQTPGIIPWLIGIGAGLGLCELSFRFFRRAKRGFPDVI